MISAAHCTSWRGIKPKIIRLGEQNLKRKDDDHRVEDFEIAQIIRHPNYRASSKYNDIALFQLNQNVRINDFIRPACLWQQFDAKYTRYSSNQKLKFTGILQYFGSIVYYYIQCFRC